jgi:hypothetical protein
LTHLVFLGTEVRLEIGFSAAQARLANLTRGGLLRRACGDAYHELGTGLARVGGEPIMDVHSPEPDARQPPPRPQPGTVVVTLPAN